MKVNSKTTLIFEFDRIDDKDEIGDLAMFLIKCKKEAGKSGFKNFFSDTDKKIIDKFFKDSGLYEGSPD